MIDRPVPGGSELPVRVVEVVERDGRHVHALHVFCARQGRSIDPVECVGCSCALMVSNRMVVCALPGAVQWGQAGQHLFLGPDALGLRTPLGAVCAPRVVAFRVGARSSELEAAVAREPFVVVLGDDDQVRAIVSERFSSEQPADAVESWLSTLDETASLNEAIEWMIRRGRRVLPLRNARGRFVGVMTDLDVLHWARGRSR